MKANEESFMEAAIQESYAGMAKGNRPYASLLVNSEGKIVMKAHNTVLEENDPLAHGETNVISAYCRIVGKIDLSGYTLYATSEPCPMCTAAICWANISRLVFGSFREDFSNPGYTRQNIRVTDYYKSQNIEIQVTEAVLRNKVISMYDEFRKNLNKKVMFALGSGHFDVILFWIICKG